MSGLKNFFRKNTKHENNQQIVTPQRRSSSDENFDDEELYEAVDLEQESAPYRPCSADDCDQWSENEFEDDEDIYTNDSELLQTPVVEIPKTPEAPILPPRSRGQPQIDHSIPSTTNLPPRIPDYRPAALSQQDSEDTADYYEEFSEESNRNVLHSNVDEDSDSEDYETVNSEVVSKRPSPLPTPRRSPAPEPIPSLPPRSIRPGLPQPTIQAQILEETYVDNNTTSARQDGGLFSKMASALKQNLLNLSSRSTNSKQAEVPDEPCIYEVEDTPPIPQKYPSPQTSSRPLPESPKIESPEFEEMYEVTSDLPVVPSAPKPSAKDKVTPGPRKLSPVPPVPSDRFVGFKAESLSKRAKQKLPEPDPEDDICNYELENDSPPPSTTKIIPTKPKTPAIVQNEKQKSMESEPAFPKHRLVPYTPVIPKGKGVSDPDGQPKSSFLMKNLPSKNGIPSSECNAVKKDNSDMTSSGDSKPAVGSLTCIVPNKNKYLKPITPKIQIQRASESDESNLLEKSNKPTKGNYPRHIPPKLQVPKTDVIDSKKGKDETLISSNTSKVLDASMNCLEENKDKKRTSEFSSKSSNHQIAPLIQEPRNKGVHRKPLLTPESKTQKDFPETQTSAVDKKVTRLSDGHVSELMNIFEQNSPPNKSNLSFNVGKNVNPACKINPPFNNGTTKLHEITRLAKGKDKTVEVKDKMINKIGIKHDNTVCKERQTKKPEVKPNIQLATKKPEVKPNIQLATKKPEVKPNIQLATKKPEVKLNIQLATKKPEVKPNIQLATKKPEVKLNKQLATKNQVKENNESPKVSEIKGKLFQQFGNKNGDILTDEKGSRTAEVKPEVKTKTTVQSAKSPNACNPWKSLVSSNSPLIHKEHGRIASNDLDDSSWYMPDATREDSDKKLKFIGKDGAFLIRKSQRGASLTPYSMSVFQSGRIFNLQIRKRSDNKYAIGSEKVDEKTFTSLSDLVSFHENSPIEIMGGGAKVYLKHPANK